MTATLPDVAARKKEDPSAEQQVATELVRQAKEHGLSLTGPNGSLKQLTKVPGGDRGLIMMAPYGSPLDPAP
jgi:hypothetical protein